MHELFFDRYDCYLGSLGAGCERAPRLLHYMVSLTPTGLARDMTFVLIARASGRNVIAHVHGDDLGRHRSGDASRQGASDRSARASVESVTIAPSLAARLTVLGMPASSVMNPLRGVDLGQGRAGAGQARAVSGCSSSEPTETKRNAGTRPGTRARQESRDVDATLALVGKEEHRGEESELRELVQELGVEAAVSFPGVVERLQTRSCVRGVFGLLSSVLSRGLADGASRGDGRWAAEHHHLGRRHSRHRRGPGDGHPR